MYAIVDIAGQQMKVEKDEKIFIHLLEGDTGAPVHFNRVLLIDNDKDILVGDPLLSDALITGKILSHVKGDKIKVFKKKRRKGFKVMKGHRQFFTEVQIEEILEKGGSKILKDIEAKSETKKTVKTEEAEKHEAAARAVTKKVKPSPDTDTEKASKAEGKVKKVAETPESKTKKPGVKAAGKKSSTTGKPSEGKATKSASAASDKTGTKATAKPKTSTTKKTPAAKTTVTTKKTAATKKSDKKK